MAKVVEKMPGKSETDATYDWNNWLDGRIWELKRGIDFQIQSHSFRSVAHSEATKRGVTIKTSISGDTIFIRAKD